MVGGGFRWWPRFARLRDSFELNTLLSENVDTSDIKCLKCHEHRSCKVADHSELKTRLTEIVDGSDIFVGGENI